MIELTHSATVMIDVALCGQSPRGACVNLRKTKGGKHGRFVVEMLARRVDPATLPNEKDPMVILTKLWEWNQRKLAKE